MAMAPRNSAPGSQAAKGGAAASSVAAAWNSGRLAGVMAVLLGSGAQLGGGTSQRLRPGGASVGMKGMRGMGMPRLCDLQGFSGTSIRSGTSGLVALSFPIPLIPHSRLHLQKLAAEARSEEP